MSNKTNLKKALALAGLALLYVVLVFLSEFIGFISPWCWILYSALAAILAAWPVFKAVRMTGGKCVFLIFGIVFTLTYFTEMGWNTVPSAIASIVLAIAAEAVHGILGYGSSKALRVAYPVFALVPLGNIICLWTDTARYAESAVEENGQAYSELLSHMGTAWTLILAVVAVVVMALFAVNLFCKKEA